VEDHPIRKCPPRISTTLTGGPSKERRGESRPKINKGIKKKGKKKNNVGLQIWGEKRGAVGRVARMNNGLQPKSKKDTSPYRSSRVQSAHRGKGSKRGGEKTHRLKGNKKTIERGGNSTSTEATGVLARSVSMKKKEEQHRNHPHKKK